MPTKHYIDGVSLVEWSHRTGISYSTLYTRFRRYSDVDVVLAPSLLGVPAHLGPISRLGFTRQALHSRIRAGWTVEEATTTPKNPRHHRRHRCGRCGEIGHYRPTCYSSTEKTI